MPDHADLIFIHGPPAAGKYTIGSLVAEALDSPLFHNHLTVDLVATLFEFGSDSFNALRADIWLAAFRRAHEAGSSLVFTFNPEASVAPQLISDLQAVFDSPSRILNVALTLSEEDLGARLASPSRAEFGKLTDVAQYREIRAKGGFDFPPLPVDIRIDTAQMPVSQSAARIVRAHRDRA